MAVSPRKSGYGASRNNNFSAEELPPTTHSMKSSDGYVSGVFITEIDGQFGPSLKVNIKGTVKPGTYFINPKKDYKGLGK